MCAAVGFAALVLQAQEPASYPHDMSAYGCTNRDENTCDSAPAPPPDYNPLVGTWIRYSLLRNGFSVQPPDAPLYVKFMNDGYWSMMEFPADRPKVNKPLEQQTTKELFSRFDKMSGGWGNYSNSGQVNFRHHKPVSAPEAARIRRSAPGDSKATSSSSRARARRGRLRSTRGSCRIRRSARRALVGSWERTAYTVNDAAGTTTPEHLLLGEDGWYHATTLPAGRKGVPKVPQDQWTPEQYAAAYNGMSASRGTYNVQGTTFVRRHIGDTDPNLEDKLSTGTFAVKGDTFTWQGTDAAGRNSARRTRR